MRKFFFSSRRRHTRSYGDWSSDVCSSDLQRRPRVGRAPGLLDSQPPEPAAQVRRRERDLVALRSEERRVGKECRSWGAQPESTKKLKFMRASIKMTGVSNLQRFSASTTQT